MTDITPENVARMLDGVTPGPWDVQHFSHKGYQCLEISTGQRPAIAGVFSLRQDMTQDLPMQEANARFIAWAREAVPALSARLAEVEADLTEAEEDLTTALEKLAAAEVENAKLQNALDALRGADMPDVNRSTEFLQGAHWGVRKAIAWMHDRAEEMVDQRAKDILNATATNLGMWKGWHLRNRKARAALQETTK